MNTARKEVCRGDLLSRPLYIPLYLSGDLLGRPFIFSQCAGMVVQ